MNLVTANKESTSPDLNNIACQIKLDFSRREVTINTVIGGESRSPKNEGTDPDELFSGNCYLNITKSQVVVTGDRF